MLDMLVFLLLSATCALLLIWLLRRGQMRPYGHNKHFEYGYSGPTHNRREISPNAPDVWNHAQAKVEERFKDSPLMMAVMGRVYQRLEPASTDEFDRVLNQHAALFAARPDAHEPKENWIWNPLQVIDVLQRHWGADDYTTFSYFYTRQKTEPANWAIVRFGLTSHTPSGKGAKLSYYEQFSMSLRRPGAGGGSVEASFSGRQDRLSSITFTASGDASAPEQVIERVCAAADLALRELMDFSAYGAVGPLLTLAHPEPFQVETGDIAVKFTTKISKPHWTEPDHIDARIELERIADAG